MIRHTLGNRGKDALISTMFQAGSHSNNDNIQVDLRKYLAMISCLISAVIDLSLRSQPIKALWSVCIIGSIECVIDLFRNKIYFFFWILCDHFMIRHM